MPRPTTFIVKNIDNVVYCKNVRNRHSRGNCFDNAVVESFFGTLKTEVDYHHMYTAPAEARQAIFEYLEVSYNRRRRHSTLGYLSPAEYEAQYRELPSESAA